jgi:hypothetical protein
MKADWTKHAKEGSWSIAPDKAVEIDPANRDGIEPFVVGPAILSCKVNFSNLPTVASGKRPTHMLVWARRTADGEKNNATGQGTLAVPQDDDPVFKAVWTYQTWVEVPEDKVRFYLEHNAGQSLNASLQQIIVTAFGE